jgi:hypothetical protein
MLATFAKLQLGFGWTVNPCKCVFACVCVGVASVSVPESVSVRVPVTVYGCKHTHTYV